MQPKTKAQKRVMELFSTLKPLTKAQEKWGKMQNLKADAFFDRTGNICAFCGGTMGESLICPVCKQKHTKRAINNRMWSQETSFNITAMVGEYQVLRTYIVHSLHSRKNPVQQSVCEVCQSWVDTQGRVIRVARQKSFFGGSYLWSTPMEVRKEYKGYYGGDLHNYIQDTYTYPIGNSLLPTLKRNGLKSFAIINEGGTNPVEYIRDILTNPKAETMLKTGYGKFVGLRGVYDRYWQSLRVAMRHHYTIPDWVTWRDTLDLLRDLGMDTHNPVYICSDDLKGLHDRLVARKQRMTRQQIERNKNIALMKNTGAKADYIRNKQAYFGICITDEELTIEVLKSIEDFIAEGEYMHHCVCTNNYYSKNNSLILSAKINGERIETIEVDLTKFNIVQSRGKYNSSTPYHDRIVDLMNANMGQIRKIKQKANKTQKVA